MSQSYNKKFKNSISSFEYICLKDAIPQKWRRLLKLQYTIEMTPKDETVYFSHNKIFKPIKLKKSSQIYLILNTKNIEKILKSQNAYRTG